MYSNQLAFVSPTAAPAWQRWLVFSPVARIGFFAATLLLLWFAVYTTLPTFGWTAKTASPLQHALATLCLQLLPALASYLLLVKLIERRQPHELSLRSLVTFGAAGLLAGAALFSTVVGMLWLLGSYHVVGVNPQVHWLPAVLVAGVGAGIGEELITRGVLFRILEEGLGSWWALAISALIFGAAHTANPGATLWSSLAIAIEAGVLLGLLYHVTRSLWACIGLHAAWNVMQGTVYGIPVSGIPANGWLLSTRSGPSWLSGGGFGAEASVIALALCSLCSLALLLVALHRGSLVPPCWRR
jgi:membrane protease YdiL (CAAX protease family)